MVRKIFLDYIWESCIQPQLGYSFSKPHDIAYSLEALQEAHLATKYDPLFWTCACLSVNSGSNETDLEDEIEIAQETTPQVQVEEKKKANNTNYGKIAKAIGEVQSQGYKVNLPHINLSQRDFLPNVKEQTIEYGLQAIVNVNEDMIEKIIQNRPYASLEDFISKVELTNVQMISLIKAGCFDKLENKNREFIMQEYLHSMITRKVTKKTKLTLSHLPKLIEYGAIPEEFLICQKMFFFKKWIDTNCLSKQIDGTKIYELSNEDELKFFGKIIKHQLTVGKEYDTIIEGYNLKVNSFKKFYDNFMSPLKEWMSTENATETFYDKEVSLGVQELWDKYCQGCISKWEMDALSFYYSGHELADVKDTHNTVNFDLLPEELTPSGYKTNKQGQEVPIYDIVKIMGTIVNIDKGKNIVSLLTPHGVVDCKMYGALFNQYTNKITQINQQGKKVTIEEAWFKRGNKLLVSGVRRETSFVVKQDYSTYGKAVRLIANIDKSELVLLNDRVKVK